MKIVAVLMGTFLLWGSAVGAQTSTSAADPGAMPVVASSWHPSVGSGAASAPPVLTAELMPSDLLLAPSSPAWASLPSPEPAEPPQGVQGVFPVHHWQAYAGYTFLRFYEVPNHTENENGFNVSGAYYFKDWIAADGELLAGFSSQSGLSSQFVLVAGGPRLRWSRESGPELWVHALVGAAHSSPQTVYGSENAFGFALGGGVDINSRHRRLAYRLQADIVGTRFFSTYQYSPKISAGIVYKF
jgi:hypothetical protein